MDKNLLRNIIKDKRINIIQNGLLEEISHKVSLQIVNSEVFKNSTNIALYHALADEININELLKCKDKNFFLPKCIGSDLFFAPYSNNLVKGSYSIFEPAGDVINPEILDVIYVPCLCCNISHYRLGYGKGFYDRFFVKNNIKAKKIIVSSSDFITSDFVQDSYDYKCDYIVCEKGMI